MRPILPFREGMMAAWDFLFPPACLVCNVPLNPERKDYICRECRGELRVLVPVDCLCRETQATFTWEERQRACEFCRKLPDSFDSVRAAFPYSGVIGEMIRNLKYRQGEVAGRALAQLLVAGLADDLAEMKARNEIDAVVAVPMYFVRRLKRGYNQAECIARPLADFLRVKYEGDLVRRCRQTPPQARRSSPEQRLLNVKDAFEVPEPGRVSSRRFLLVDDVMTTGATLASCAVAMKAAGAAAVHVIAVANAGAKRTAPAPEPMRG